MGNGGKMAAMIQAAQTVVNTLSISDWIGITTFNGQVLNYFDTLVRANSTNKLQISSFLSNLTVGSAQTNYELAFTSAFNMISTTFDNEDGITCNTIILFMSGSNPTSGEQDPATLLSLVQELDNYNTLMFLFGLGTDIKPEILQLFGCNFNGVYHHVANPTDLSTALTDYFNFIAAGLTRTTPIWTEPYADSSGLGVVTTLAYPIYDKTVNPPFLIAVMSVDLLLADLKRFGENSDSILYELIQRSEKCTLNLLSECQMESLRGEFKCNSTNSTCDPISQKPPSCQNFNKNPWMAKSSHIVTPAGNLCCGNFLCDITVPTDIVVGGTLGAVLVVVIVVFIVKKVGCCKKKHEEIYIPTKQSLPSQVEIIQGGMRNSLRFLGNQASEKRNSLKFTSEKQELKEDAN